MVAQVQVQAEELGKQAWEGEEIHLQQMLKVFLWFFFTISLLYLKKNNSSVDTWYICKNPIQQLSHKFYLDKDYNVKFLLTLSERY